MDNENDLQLQQEIAEELRLLAEKAGTAQIEAMFSGEYDNFNCFLEINAGAGGTEAQDWAYMLARMYTMWSEKRKYKIVIADKSEGEEAGVKSITLHIIGDKAYGWLKRETGVHRLVRISPFDANARRHTSFASVFASPELSENSDIQIDEKDLRIDTYRASGAGGQHVNKTDSAVRITHIPTGIVTQCQTDRSQHRNKAIAMNLLISKLQALKIAEQEEKINQESAEKTDIAWGHQIRSYVLQPYQMVKDLRTGCEIGDAYSVLNGNIDKLLESALSSSKLAK